MPAPRESTSRFAAAPLNASIFVAVAIAVVAGLAGVAELTRQRIESNRQTVLRQQVVSLLPPGSYDNDVLADRIWVRSPDRLGTDAPVPLYRARLAGRPSAAIVQSVAPDGYGGPIVLLVAIGSEGQILGVRVLAHQETPGLGDGFARPGSTWLADFTGRMLSGEMRESWTVRKDGGDFDQFTGATITPRAIIKAVQRTLEYYNVNRDRLFALEAAE